CSSDLERGAPAAGRGGQVAVRLDADHPGRLGGVSGQVVAGAAADVEQGRATPRPQLAHRRAGRVVGVDGAVLQLVHVGRAPDVGARDRPADRPAHATTVRRGALASDIRLRLATWLMSSACPMRRSHCPPLRYIRNARPMRSNWPRAWDTTASRSWSAPTR